MFNAVKRFFRELLMMDPAPATSIEHAPVDVGLLHVEVVFTKPVLGTSSVKFKFEGRTDIELMFGANWDTYEKVNVISARKVFNETWSSWHALGLIPLPNDGAKVLYAPIDAVWYVSTTLEPHVVVPESIP